MGDAKTPKFIPPVPGLDPEALGHLLCEKEVEKRRADTEHPPANESCWTGMYNVWNLLACVSSIH